ncbi:hypothetical protein GWK91_00880 [Virgibacillus sp. MSP4-1]|uniref:hypothetical protein n=1 Tax=Virgibacillus sp. MSP4-1 TaxID=2700081 RepID=UPI0003A2F570|nr:hypothetical protein [Virgibacillus sp. MSP4-1]QHS21597.1 hypothetical protein GWK91_00880 [Virgibacillus sp. MSP4-1]
MSSLINIAVRISMVLHFLWFILFFAYIFGFIGLESAFLHPAVWLTGPVFGAIISMIAIVKKTALVPAILSMIFSAGTFLLWSLILGINQF